MSLVFAGSFYFFALLNPSDAEHACALEFARTFSGTIVTSAWVLTEVADGMSAPENRETCVRFIERLRVNPAVSIHPPSAGLFDEGLALYTRRPDKYWSLTDCISFVIMQKEGIAEALTGDHHFQQAGFQTLLH